MSTTNNIAAWFVSMTLVAGCAQLGGPEGGAEELPNRGITSYENASLGDPPSAIVLKPSSASSQTYGEPSTVLYDAKVHLYVHAVTEWNGEGEIILLVSDDEGETFSEPKTVADAPTGTQGVIQAPSVSCIGDTCILAAMAGSPSAIYLADGAPQGPFVWRDSPIVEPTDSFELGGIGSPCVVLEENRIIVYYTAQENADGPTSIAGGVLPNDGVVEKWGVIVSPDQGCTSSSGDNITCWNEFGVLEPEVKVATTGTGRTLYRMIYTGNNGSNPALGFAASWDGQTFEPFALNPTLEGGKMQASNIRVGDRYLMYYVPSSRWDAGKIALAINEQGNATESF